MSVARGLVAAVVVGWALSSSPARAHERSTSMSTIRIEGGTARVRLTLRLIDVAALADAGVGRDGLRAHLTGALRLEPCVVEEESFVALAAERTTRSFEWRLRCDRPPERLVADVVPTRPHHVHHARVVTDAGTIDCVSSARAPAASIAQPAADGVVGRYFVEGIGHVAGGADHLWFLALLLFTVGSYRELGRVVLGFGAGHALSLVATVLDVVAVDPQAVEAAIGTSVVLLGAEVLEPPPRSMAPGRPAVLLSACVSSAVVGLASGQLALAGIGLAFGAVALRPAGVASIPRAAIGFAFGLIHGAGFATGLRALGIPDGSAVEALVGFNVGVEIAQLVFVAALWPAVLWLRRSRFAGGASPLLGAAGAGAGAAFVAIALLG